MTTAKRLWIDCHNHIRSHAPDGGPCDITAEDLLGVLDDSGADLRLIAGIASSEVRRLKDEPEAVVWANESLDKLMSPARGRLIGSCMVHPRAVKESHEVLDRFIGERGFAQVGEVHGVQFQYDMDCPEMIELVRHAAELGAPVQMHCSTNEVVTGEHMQQIVNVARAVPEASMIVAHAIGGSNSYQYILAGEVYFGDGGDNLYFEIRDFNTREYLRAAYERLGPDRLISGTDWSTKVGPPFLPFGIIFGLDSVDENPYPCTVASLVGFLRESGVTEEDIDKIASGNIIRIHRLEERGLLD